MNWISRSCKDRTNDEKRSGKRDGNTNLTDNSTDQRSVGDTGLDYASVDMSAVTREEDNVDHRHERV